MSTLKMICQRLYVWRSSVVIAAFTTMISGCGGDITTAGVGTGGTGSVSVTGKVADGYLANASVFLDKNGNYQLDAGEPFTSTDANGTYLLTIDSADMGKYPIVAHVIKGIAIDKDTNQAVINSYVLSMPKERVSSAISNNFISPVTSQVRELMETGLFATMQQAEDALRVKMGLPAGTDMMSDYIATNNTVMHTGAQNIATLMGNQMDQIFIPNGSSTIVDVNRYRTMMGTIFSNMPTVMGVNNQAGMTNLSNTMTSTLSSMPLMRTGEPFRSMSTAFRGRM